MGAAKLVYEFSKAYQDLPDDLDVLVYSDKENNIVPFFRAQLNGQWYNVVQEERKILNHWYLPVIESKGEDDGGNPDNEQ